MIWLVLPADPVRALLLEQIPERDPGMLRWLAHQGTFSTPDGRLADVFHELTLAFDRAHHRLQNVRMLDHGEADELVTTLNLHPILEVLDRLNAHQPQQLDIALPTPPSVPKSEQPDIAKPEQRNRVKLHEPNPIGRRESAPDRPDLVLIPPWVQVRPECKRHRKRGPLA